MPVAASDPNRVTRTLEGSVPAARRRSAKCRPALIGPTVWDEDGPIPSVNMSNTPSWQALASVVMHPIVHHFFRLSEGGFILGL